MNRIGMPLEAGGLGAGRSETWATGTIAGRRDERTRFFNKVRRRSASKSIETFRELNRQLTRISRDNTADQPQRPTDEALRFAGAILLVVEEQPDRISGRVELCLEPARIEQQRVQFLAFASLGKVVGKTAVKIPACPLVPGRTGSVERCDQRLVLGDELVRPGRFAQELAHDVVQPKKALSFREIAFEQQREIEKPT